MIKDTLSPFLLTSTVATKPKWNLPAKSCSWSRLTRYFTYAKFSKAFPNMTWKSKSASFQKALIIHPETLPRKLSEQHFWGSKSVKKCNEKETRKITDCSLQSNWGETHKWIVHLFKNSLPRKIDFSVILILPTFDFHFNSVRSWSRAQCDGIVKPKTLIKVFYMLKSTELIARTNFSCQVRRKKIISEITNRREIDWFKHKRRQLLILLSFFEDSGFRKVKLQFLFTYIQHVIATFLILTLTTRDIDECCCSYSVHNNHPHMVPYNDSPKLGVPLFEVATQTLYLLYDTHWERERFTCMCNSFQCNKKKMFYRGLCVFLWLFQRVSGNCNQHENLKF